MNGAGSRLSVGSPQPRLGSFPRPPHTWKDMKSQGAKNAPVLLEIPKTEDAFEKVYDLFRGDWKTPGRPKVTVHRIFIVYQSQDIIARHEQFKQQLCSDSEGPVRESRRWIGVGHTCMLLKSGFVTPCTSLRCTLCDVVRRNVYSPVDFPRMIPATGTSNKADKLAFPVASTEVTHKAMLLTKVVSSDEEKMTADEMVARNNSASLRRLGFIQLLQPTDEGDESSAGGTASDQLLVFSSDAILARYLVVYS
ncbi:hypothetical protein CC1G_09697 [Coprinopsis cinerea okayama7|uniref:Uncharacterized protein n=1 Tax=Coprinopsis cinerea (strain Okayama-7 / 130 / ATCC MYA-4618 / FGSC 9003) TaxID=240176 RepID=A8NJD0_COPC7|nr:hypothetical protein CC1G_09697 [Coprinopsis cinerea okayama7\|eukprot:XP_001834197.2 hypothetical protein CC1G_09697 [Coprinopsis cinerea okayama7\